MQDQVLTALSGLIESDCISIANLMLHSIQTRDSQRIKFLLRVKMLRLRGGHREVAYENLNIGQQVHAW